MLRIFRHYIPSSLLILMFIEAMLLWVSVYMGVEIRFLGEGRLSPDIFPLWPKAMVLMIVNIGALTATGLYKNIFREGLEGMLIRLGWGLLLGMGGTTIIFYLLPALFLGRGVLVIAIIFATLSIAVARLLFFKLVGREAFRRRVIVLGAGRRAEQFKQLRRQADQLGFNILGFVHVQGEEDVMPPEKVINLDVPLLEYVLQNGVDEIVVAVKDRRKSFPLDDLLDCRMSGINVIDLLTFFERETGKVRLETLRPSWLIFSDGFQQAGFQLAMKRVFDIAASLLILSLAWPFMLVAALAILVEGGGKGPIFYKQVRVGQNWKLFQVIKFRSMVVDAEKDGAPQWAQKNDSRVTRVGEFIRKTRIDELPQIFNVLSGSMSFIGPRPERPEFVEELSEKIPYYAERHRVKPGITGWAQIRYPYGASEQDALEKLQYDLYYVKNYSLFLDSLILFQTAEVVLWGNGAR